MPMVTFIPDGISVEVEAGENLLRAALMADVHVTASCGGSGTCGKCRLVVSEGSVAGGSSTKLSADEVARGYVLGCASKVTGDVTVTVPEEARPGAAPVAGRSGRVANPVLSAHELDLRVPHKRLTPPVAKHVLEVSAPDLNDNASDLTRVRNILRKEHLAKRARITPQALRALPAALREGEWTVTVTLFDTGDGEATIVAVEPGDARGAQYAVAVDVGTTTVAVSLIDLAEGVVLAHAAEYNAQVARGDDVVTRVVAATKAGGLDDLRGLVTGTIVDLVERACAEARVSPAGIIAYLVAGNTVMTHLLLGISPASIRVSPYTPAASSFPWMPATDLGLPGDRAAMLGAMPCPASWLGGDVVAGVVACGMPWAEKLTLFIDIGTNGEIVLGDKDFMIACSCSAGPAFEGGGIRHGMRAADGAVEQVRIDDVTLEPSLLTIGGVKPLGICGSGLIDCVSELFLAGALDRNGRFVSMERSDRLRATESGEEYVLVWAKDSGTGGDIVIAETDIENLMRAKAAIHAGIDVLADSLDLDIIDVEEVVVAGGFGHYLDIERITAIGMFPELPKAEFLFCGNTSLAGAARAAVSRDFMTDAYKVAESLTYLELSVNAGFMDNYMSSMFFPHTDLGQFPEAEKLRASRASQTAVT